MMSDDYVEVTAKLRAVRPKAVLLDVNGQDARGAWVPRSCIHGADDRGLDNIALGEEVTLRMFKWIADREGLI